MRACKLVPAFLASRWATARQSFVVLFVVRHRRSALAERIVAYFFGLLAVAVLQKVQKHRGKNELAVL